MTKEQKIISKLYEAKKVELGTHEILLADFSDIDTQINKAESEYKKVIDYSNRIYAIQQEAKKNTSIDVLPRIVAELKNDRDVFISKVKALGIDETKVPQPKKYQSAIDRISALSDKAKQYINEFNK